MSEDDYTYKWVKCSRCSKLRQCTLIEDPFLREVFPEGRPYGKEWWCDDCAEARRDDI